MIRELLGFSEGILQDLHHHHKEVWRLINRIRDSSDPSLRGFMFDEMKAKIIADSQAEEEVLYTRLAEHDDEEARDFVEESREIRSRVEKLLERLGGHADTLSEAWREDLEKLRQVVKQHIDEDESVGFSCARRLFDKKELAEIGGEFKRRREMLIIAAH